MNTTPTTDDEQLEPRCHACLGRVDADGTTTSECPAIGPVDPCPTCGACTCDGSC